MDVVGTPYQVQAVNGLQFYQFPALANTRHAVFSRIGGVSPSPWQALNMSQAVGDTADRVRTNFDTACNALNIDTGTIARSHLVHGNSIAHLTTPDQVARYPQVDGLITQLPEINLMMSFADCVPLLFHDARQQAIGLAHAGWRGTALNMVGRMIAALQQQCASEPDELTIVIGPSIGPCCYEIKDDVVTAVAAQLKQTDDYIERRQGRTYLNLWAINEQQAQTMGVRDVVVSGLCTACHTDKFFSHRAEKGNTGRFGVFLGVGQNDC